MPELTGVHQSGGISLGELKERQVERLKKTFRESLAAGESPETARQKIEDLIGDMLGLEHEESLAAAQRIEGFVLDELGKVATLDVPAIDARAQTRWYTGPQPDDTLWPSLRHHLIEHKDWTESSVDSIDEQSSSIVARLGPPRSQPEFSSRGLVVGYVQSGKTANMTAVIAKAVDAGYRLVIILAGLTDSLREQTQQRMEADLVNHQRDQWDSLTTAESDFDAGTRMRLVQPKRGAILAVVKKNTHILARLRDFLEGTGYATRAHLPTIVIDDETDQASPNVSRQDREDDPSAINLRIREILRRLPKCSYVGYTATPFANVLINPGAEGTEQYDRDLYPRDFIVSLPAPPDYFGAETLFGRDMLSADDTGLEQAGLDVIRTISEDDLERLKALTEAGSGGEDVLPPSLKDAIAWFVLASAVRDLRDPEHTTMLLHTSRLTLAHQAFEAAVRVWLENLKSRPGERRELMQRVWSEEASRVPPEKYARLLPPAEQVLSMADRLITDLRVVQDNYVSEANLTFGSDDPPLHAIIIGGDRLARGVTLPGLLVSYFGRASRQYDTLMQMGRWFGYRHGYEELPRIWMTASTQSSFRELATIEAELREDIRVYRDGSIQPMDWGVRIRKVPGLLITRPAAMLHAARAKLSYSGEHLQTIRFRHRDPAWLGHNWAAGARLLERASDDPSTQSEHLKDAWLLRYVPVDAILEFFNAYQTVEQIRTDTYALRKYIESYSREELVRWNVALIMPASGRQSDSPLGPVDAPRLVNRSAMNNAPEDCTDIKALMSRGDILVDVGSRPPDVKDNWRSLKSYRAQVQGGTGVPLLLLYPIDRDSQPNTEGRRPLEAVAHVLGIGLVFPDDPTGFQGHYITVDPAKLVGADPEEE